MREKTNILKLAKAPSHPALAAQRATAIAGIALALTTSALLTACSGGSDSHLSSPVQNSQTCAALAGKTIDASAIGEPTTGAVVTSAVYERAVADAPDSTGTTIVQGTPEYCQLLVDIKPVDPNAPMIKSEVNLPTAWNGKKLQMGGGGYNGVLVTGLGASYNAGPNVPLPLTQGYMTAGTDSGHENSSTVHPAAFALNNEALTNFAYAAYKKTNDVAVQLGVLYYGRKPNHSYYVGGSQGGREGMMMVQRYPNDFDGVVAIDPVMNATALWTTQNSFGALQSAPGSWLGNKTQLVQNTIDGACDALDGIVDNVVSNYKACTASVAIAALTAKRCASGADEGSTCFSDGQLNVLKSAYNGYQFPFALANGITAYAGYVPGSEDIPNNMAFWIAGTAAPTATPDTTTGIGRSYQFGSYYARFFIAKDPNFNALNYNPADFQARVLEVSNMIDATNPDLTAFYKHGGKLILREDLGDKGQSARTGLNFWDAVVAKMGKDTVGQFFSAYVTTGLGHTSGGLPAGTANAPTWGTPGRVDLLAQIDNWVDKGVKPADQMTLENRQALPPYSVVASKPMCRYGTYPKFNGSGTAGGELASNYVCATN
ncbi:tannase/feruloyl esterase family alpha/beta hydrolase [Paraburkholderia sp. MM5482-R1]|uniref:tannase/feruloyl esterase family alpha/beta hydrolase n=1 Tax=unclassified Paraburkholderia TaxID=2615204 RepID=UPI003D227B96